MKGIIASLLFFFCISISDAQKLSDKLDSIQNRVTSYNDELQYEKSIAFLTDYITQPNVSPFEKYHALLLKAHTYKRLFNYPKTLYNLELALEEGRQSDRKDEVENCIKAERCYVYFDTQDYSKAKPLMEELAAVNYQYLHPVDKAWIIMQEGYLAFLEKNFLKSEEQYETALLILKSEAPQQLPNVYGKMMELYQATGQLNLRDRFFEEGIKNAKASNKIKYELYLHEVMKNILQKSNDYKKAFDIQQQYDSLNAVYNSIENNGKIELLEKKLEGEKLVLTEKNLYYEKVIGYSIVAFLSVLLIITFLLFRSNKQRRILVEKENEYIHNEVERLSIELTNRTTKEINIEASTLTERQREIIELVKKGMTNKEIAASLFISENTVKYHLKIIYELLNVEHRTQLSNT